MNNSNVINLHNVENELAGAGSYKAGLSSTIHSALTQYLNDLDGENPGNIYDLVIQQVEAPLLEIIMSHVDGNQSKAAEYLGLNRGTLRKKLKIHQLLK